MTARPTTGSRLEPVRTTVSGVVDLDVHPALPRPDALDPYLASRWRTHRQRFGHRIHGGLAAGYKYPPFMGGAQRADAWPASGGPPGSDLPLLQEQLLDAYGIELGVLTALEPAASQLNQEYGAAIARALNDWQLEHFVAKDARLRVAIAVAYETPELAVAEIERVGADPGVVGVLMLSRTLEPLGRRRYWPIYEAAERHGLPILIHLIQTGGYPNTSSGWASYHQEYHVSHVQAFQAQLLSLICEGTFERFPGLRFALLEGGLAWVPTMLGRLDHHWELLRSEVPQLERRPSEYLRDHVWVSTQPMDEPRRPAQLIEIFEELGIENVVFASDYPHFDFDSPTHALPKGLTDEQRRRILVQNASELFGLEHRA